MKTRRSLLQLLPVVFLLLIIACSLPMRPPPGQIQNAASLPPNLSITSVFPSLLPTKIILPSMTHTQSPSSTRLPPTPTRNIIPHQPSQTNTPAISISSNNLSSVVLIADTEALFVREQPSIDAKMVESLAFNTQGIQLTGQTAGRNNPGWVEVKLPSGKTGWVIEQYLTETVPAASFSKDPRVPALLSQFQSILEQKDGKGLAGLISPKHGLRLTYLRGGTIAAYNVEKATWLFESTYSMNWGIHPGSGMPVRGSFSQEVLPALLDVLKNPGMQIRYEDVRAGGTTYTATWPKEYANINFLSAYRPGPAGQELNWRTWLIGVEYVAGKPYLFALNMLVWEP